MGCDELTVQWYGMFHLKYGSNYVHTNPFTHNTTKQMLTPCPVITDDAQLEIDATEILDVHSSQPNTFRAQKFCYKYVY